MQKLGEQQAEGGWEAYGASNKGIGTFSKHPPQIHSDAELLSAPHPFPQR